MEVTNDATNETIVLDYSGAVKTVIQKKNITNVGGNALQNSVGERSSIHFKSSRTGKGGRVYIHLVDGRKVVINLITVTNQATWIANGADKTDVETAVDDINSWLP